MKLSLNTKSSLKLLGGAYLLKKLDSEKEMHTFLKRKIKLKIIWANQIDLYECF